MAYKYRGRGRYRRRRVYKKKRGRKFHNRYAKSQMARGRYF